MDWCSWYLIFINTYTVHTQTHVYTKFPQFNSFGPVEKTSNEPTGPVNMQDSPQKCPQVNDNVVSEFYSMFFLVGPVTI